MFSARSFAQISDVSAETGLPLPIGAPVIYGRVAINGIPKEAPRPMIFVSLLVGGAQVDRMQTDSRGYYFFLQRPSPGQVLKFEVDDMEVGRAYLNVGTSTRIRQDIALDWTRLKGTPVKKSGVISAKDHYDRSEEAEKMFDAALKAIREDKPQNAVRLFSEIVAKDANDFLAWTMLGSIYSSERQFEDARSALEKALKLKPDFLLAMISLGQLELGQKNYARSIEILAPAVQANPDSADANHALGEAYLQARKGSLAVGFLNRAIELAPIEKAAIHLRLAALYDGAGLKDRAAAEYKLFLEKVKDHPDKKKFEAYIQKNAHQ